MLWGGDGAGVCKCLSRGKALLPKSRAAQPAERDVSGSWKLKPEDFKIEIEGRFLRAETQNLGAAAGGMGPS